MNFKKDTYLIFTGLFLAGVCLISLPFENGYTLWDEGGYVNLAIRLANGLPISLGEDLFANRFGTYLLPALWIKLFGFSEHLTWIFTGLFIILLAVVYRCLSFNKQVAFFTVILLGTSPILIQESSRVMSDVLGCFTASLPVLIYLHYINNANSNSRKLAIIAGLILGYSIITRESFLFIIPAMLWIAGTSNKKGYWFAVAGSTGVIALLVIAGYWINNDLFVRLKTIYQGHITEGCGYATASAYQKLLRISYQPFQLLAENFSYGALLLPAAFNFLGPQTTNTRVTRPYLVITLLVFWLCPETITFLNPVPLAPRLWMPLIVPLAVNAAFGLQQIEYFGKKQKIVATVLTALFLVAALAVLYISGKEHAARGLPGFSQLLDIAYIVISALIIACIWMEVKFKTTLLVTAIVLSQLAALFAGRMIGNSAENAVAYRAEKEALLKLARRVKPGDCLITDSALKRNHIIYGDVLNIQYLSFDDTLPEALKYNGRQVFLYINKKRVNMFANNLNETAIYTSADYNKLPEFVLHPGKDFGLIDSSSTYRLYILK